MFNTAFSNFTNGGWLPSLHLCLLRNTLLHSFPHTFNLSTLTSYTLPHLPTLTPYSIPHRPLHMGANPGRMGDVSPPRIWQHPPNTFNVQVAYRYSKLGISERDDLFFGLHCILGKKLGICKLFVFLLFTLF